MIFFLFFLGYSFDDHTLNWSHLFESFFFDSLVSVWSPDPFIKSQREFCIEDDDLVEDVESNPGFKLGKSRVASGRGEYLPDEEEMKDIIKFYESNRCSSAQENFVMTFWCFGLGVASGNLSSQTHCILAAFHKFKKVRDGFSWQYA